jgi:hypothetical protein
VAQVDVTVKHVQFRTDSSQITPLVNAISAMMTPLPAEEEQENELRTMRCLVQLRPQVADDMDVMEERQRKLEASPPLVLSGHAASLTPY